MVRPDLSGARTDFEAIWSAVEQQTSITPVDSKRAVVGPPVPDGYEFVFGPTRGANNAPGSMGFTLIDEYNESANIWSSIINGTVSNSHTCTFYYTPTNESIATNFGQGGLTVTASRGYRRQSIVVDGGFEGFTCEGICWVESYANWIGTSPSGGVLDATLFHVMSAAHSGDNYAVLGSEHVHDALPGTITAAQPLVTVPGKNYVVTFFQTSHWDNGESGGPEQDAFVDVLWNGVIASTIHPGFTPWTYFDVTVNATGNDTIAFRGGKAPLWTFVDDIGVFAL